MYMTSIFLHVMIYLFVRSETMKQKLKLINNLDLCNIILIFLSTMFSYNIFNTCILSNMSNMNFFNSSIGLYVSYICMFFIIYLLYKKIKYKGFVSVFTFISFLICSILWVINGENVLLVLLLYLLFLFLYKYTKIFSYLKLSKNIDNKNLKRFVIVFTLIVFASVASLLVFRYITYSSPNFDLGVFSQNFYYLKKCLLPLSTLERDMLLSHFTVHLSLIFYFILPIYYIFSSSLTLQVICALSITIGIIPVYKICKLKKYDNNLTLLICFVYCIYTPFITGNLFDFHENVMLVPLILWYIYFYESNNKKLFILFLFLILFVKEDAFIYPLIFGIYSLFDNKKDYGIPSVIISTLYFVGAYLTLRYFGEGIMSDRFSNLILDDSGIFGIIKTFLFNTGYFVNQFTISDEPLDKIRYVLQILIPLGFVPLYSKKAKDYILILPLLINIMTTYKYCYNINFHYCFASCALIFYLFILNVKNVKKEYLILCFVGSILVYSCFVYPNVKFYIKDYINNKELYAGADEFLRKNIPSSDTVTASTFLIPHLYKRDTIYEIYYHNITNDVDYVAIDMRFDDYDDFYDNYIEIGYNEVARYNDMIVVLKKSSNN